MHGFLELVFLHRLDSSTLDLHSELIGKPLYDEGFLGCTEGDRLAPSTQPTGASDLVDVLVNGLWQLHLEHVRDVGHVQPARRDVGAHQDARGAVSERVERFCAFVERPAVGQVTDSPDGRRRRRRGEGGGGGGAHLGRQGSIVDEYDRLERPFTRSGRDVTSRGWCGWCGWWASEVNFVRTTLAASQQTRPFGVDRRRYVAICSALHAATTVTITAAATTTAAAASTTTAPNADVARVASP